LWREAAAKRKAGVASDTRLVEMARRLGAQRPSRPLRARASAALPHVSRQALPWPKLLLDATVNIIDELQGRLPQDLELHLRAAPVWHSSVTEGELAVAAGRLDPAHPDTRQAIRQTLAALDRRPPHRILIPTREEWREAGMLAGLLAHLQGYAQAELRCALHDALLLVAARHGCAVLTRNSRGFDLLQQLLPAGRVLFYDRLE
jgi:predicted nucleic acid-binding protein